MQEEIEQIQQIQQIQEELKEPIQEENNKKKGKNPIQDVAASNIKLSTINEVTSNIKDEATNNIKAKITDTIKDKATSKVIPSQEEQDERE